MTDHLSPTDLTTLTDARRRAQRAEIELRAAQAALDLALLNVQETYGVGPGDKLNPTTGEIGRGSEHAENGRALTTVKGGRDGGS